MDVLANIAMASTGVRVVGNSHAQTTSARELSNVHSFNGLRCCAPTAPVLLVGVGAVCASRRQRAPAPTSASVSASTTLCIACRDHVAAGGVDRLAGTCPCSPGDVQSSAVDPHRNALTVADQPTTSVGVAYAVGRQRARQSPCTRRQQHSRRWRRRSPVPTQTMPYTPNLDPFKIAEFKATPQEAARSCACRKPERGCVR